VKSPPPGLEKRDEAALVGGAGNTLPVGFAALSGDAGFTFVFRPRRKWVQGLIGLVPGFFAWMLGTAMWHDLKGGHLGLPEILGGGFFIFALGFPAVAGFWFALSGLLGTRAFVRVDSNGVSIKERPLPFVRSRFIPKKELSQIHVQFFSKGGTYSVVATTENGNSYTLADHVPNKEQARYIEEEAERFLKIKDRLMPQESPKERPKEVEA
jgi:hypothetical protein